MKLVNSSHSIKNYESQLGGDYSIWEKLKLGGTGSSKTVFISGISHLEAELTSQSIRYSSFQLFPKGLLVRAVNRNNVICILIDKSEIESIHFISRRIQVKNRRRSYIVHDSQIEFILKDQPNQIKFYTPKTFYKPMKSFFNKDWLSMTNFSMDPRPPIIDKGAGLVNSLMNGFS